MKILIDLTALYDNFSGIERYAASLAAEMIKNREHSFVLVFRNKIFSMFEDAINSENVTAIILHGANRLVFNQLILPAALYRQNADAYLFLAFPSPVLLFKNKMVSAIHDIGCWDCPESMKTSSKWYFRISYRTALLTNRKILTVSEFSRRRILERLHAKAGKVARIYDGVDEKFLSYRAERMQSERVREKYLLPEKYILSLSTLEPRKNLRLLIDAYGRLAGENAVEDDLVLVGRKGWKIDDLLDGVPEGILSRIHFTGFVDERDLPDIYGMARLFVFPSKYEGFGLPPLEALACGTPVLSSDAASMPEILGDAAAYFESGRQDMLEEQLVRMLAEDDEARLTKSLAGCSRAKQFDWSLEAEKLMQILEEL